jgi:hypothetical protein
VAHGVEVRVRIGVHTSEATPVGQNYVDLAVHQVARISAGGHGGQVLLSAAHGGCRRRSATPGPCSAAYKIPARIHLRDGLPLTASGKISRHDLHEDS